MKEVKPPRFINWLMSGLCHPYVWESVEGDLYELLLKDLSQGKGALRSNMNYTFRALAFLRFRRMWSLLKSKAQMNTFGMFTFLLRTSTRNLLNHKMVSAMSLLTLIIGVVSFQLVYSWINNEGSMDAFHEKADRIYIGSARLSPNSEVMAGHIERIFGLDYSQYPEVEKYIAIHNYQPGEIQFLAKGSSFEGKAYIADSAFLDLFTFPMLYGNPNAIHDPTSILVTEKFAKRVWGDENPIGKRVEVKCDQEGVFQVGAVLKDIPSNSSLYFDYLVPKHAKPFWRRMPQDLILLAKGSHIQDLNDRVNKLALESRFKEGSISFLPLKSIYQHQPISISLFAKYGNSTNYQIMQIVAVALFLIMTVGFVNIQSTALLTGTKKLGVKRVIGATKRALIFEIIVKMLLYFLTALVLAYVFLQLVFGQYVQVLELELDQRPVFDLMMMSQVLGLVIVITAFIQTFKIQKINALQAISGRVNLFKAAFRQKAVTSIQYAIAISFLIATAMVYLQIKYMLNKDTGLNQENVFKTRFFEIIPSARQDSIERGRLLDKYRYVMHQLDLNPDIKAVSHGQPPLDFAYKESWKLAGTTDDHLPVNTMRIDPAYQQVFNLQILHGRFFYDSIDNNGDLKVVINESAMKRWGIEYLENVKIEPEQRGSADVRKFQVIGVVKDFHYEHLSQAIQPLVMPYFFYEDHDLLIRYTPGKQQQVMSYLEELYQEVKATGFFQAKSFEEQVSRQYLSEKKMNKIYLSFGLITLFLSSISLFTLAFHETKRRTKEIGIRKINGATLSNIFQMLSGSFLSTIGIGFLAACPVVGYLINHWLDHFANRIYLEWWVFPLVGITVALLALAVVGFRVLKVAKTNPVDTLRYE